MKPGEKKKFVTNSIWIWIVYRNKNDKVTSNKIEWLFKKKEIVGHFELVTKLTNELRLINTD